MHRMNTSFTPPPVSEDPSKQLQPEVIDLLDSDDDEEEVRSPCFVPQTRSCHDVARIAIGTHVFHRNCKLAAVGTILELSYYRANTATSAKSVNDTNTNSPTTESSSSSSSSSPSTHRISVPREVEETKYFLPGEQQQQQQPPTSVQAFLSMTVVPTLDNGLLPIELEDTSTTQCVVVLIEFHSNADCKRFLNATPFLGSCLNSHKEAAQCSHSLVLDLHRNEKRDRANEKVLVRYPFPEHSQPDSAARGLSELKLTTSGPRGEEYDSSDDERMILDNSNKGDAPGEARRRAHYLEIRGIDLEKLEPGKFWNDSLIDFCLQWYVPRGI
jgi:hypothetical protein